MPQRLQARSCLQDLIETLVHGVQRFVLVHGVHRGMATSVASRRSRQSCSPSTAASLTSCRAAQTMSTAPSTGTEAHERRATRQRAQRALGFPPARCLTSQGTRPRAPVPPPRLAGPGKRSVVVQQKKALRPRRPRFSLVKATLLVQIVISGFGSF
jgi:hypothetical protein